MKKQEIKADPIRDRIVASAQYLSDNSHKVWTILGVVGILILLLTLYSNNKIIGTYVNSILALHDAIDKEADEALLLDKNGFISEGSGENIFIVKDSTLYTPRTDFCLNGITRQSVIEIAGRMDIPIQEKDLTYDDLLDADEAFFSGTAVEITPITILDKKSIGNGLRGKITEKLQSKYSEIVSGQDSNYDHWLTRL